MRATPHQTECEPEFENTDFSDTFQTFRGEVQCRGTRNAPGQRRRSESNFSNLQIGGAVRSHHVPGPARARDPENAADFQELLKLSEGKFSFGGPASPLVPKEIRPRLLQLTERGSSLEPPVTRLACRYPENKRNSARDFPNFQRGSAVSGDQPRPRSREEIGASTSNLQNGGAVVRSRFRTQARVEILKYGEYPRRLFKLSEGKCSFGGTGFAPSR
jgi:hypothetical protein